MKVFYIHVPKTGGTSIKKALVDHDGVVTESSSCIKNHPIFHRHHLKVMNFKMSNVCRFREILGETLWETLWKVAFVRNPWDRYVSNWHWLTRKEAAYPKKGWKARGWRGEDGQISFENFVKQTSQCYIELNRLHGYQHDKWHLRNQLDHLVDANGKLLVDHIARFENMEEGFSLLCRKADLAEIELPYLNHSGHFSGEVKTGPPSTIHYSSFYTPELVEIVSARCLPDIEAFGYEFEWKK